MEPLTLEEPILVVGRSVPPKSGGTPSIIANQLSWIEGRFVFVGQRPGRNETKLNLAPGWVSCPVAPRRPGSPLLFWEVVWAARIVMIALRAAYRHQCRAMMLVQFEDSYLAAGWIVAWAARLPLILYIADFWAEPPREGVSVARQAVSRWLQRCVVRRASAVVSNNARLARFAEETYGIGVEFVPHCFARTTSPLPPRSAPRGGFIVGFCGTVYWNNLDRLHALAEALHAFPDSKLVVFGSASSERLAKRGINPPQLDVRFVPDGATLLTSLADCDLLFLPGSFEVTGVRALTIKWMMPAKVLDYLGAGRPILLNCPRDSDLATLLGPRKAALLVDDPGVGALRDAIRLVREDSALREELAQGAHAFALEHQQRSVPTRLCNALRHASRSRTAARGKGN